MKSPFSPSIQALTFRKATTKPEETRFPSAFWKLSDDGSLLFNTVKGWYGSFLAIVDQLSSIFASDLGLFSFPTVTFWSQKSVGALTMTGPLRKEKWVEGMPAAKASSLKVTQMVRWGTWIWIGWPSFLVFPGLRAFLRCENFGSKIWGMPEKPEWIVTPAWL